MSALQKWKATLPRELPPSGRANVVFGYKIGAGRCEFSGEIDSATAHKIMRILIDARRINGRDSPVPLL